MQKLLRGALTFRRHMFSAYRDLFERLAHGQTPEALFITCSDSRVVPNLITATDPGDLFVLRNIGNIIPPYDPDDKDNAEAAAIEYALRVLGVRDIVICGHSGCGAMKAAQNPANLEVTQVRSWLRHVNPALAILREYEQAPHKARLNSEAARVDFLGKCNVLAQLRNIMTYPAAIERFETGRLQLHPWFFEIDTAQVYRYSQVDEQFLPIERSISTGAGERSSPAITPLERKSA